MWILWCVGGARAYVRTGDGIGSDGSQDTAFLMGLEEEFEAAAKWVTNELNFEKVGQISVFEVAIRELGGLVRAHHRLFSPFPYSRLPPAGFLAS